MINISGFFDKFIKLDKNNNERLFSIIKIIENHTGIKLNKENIIISNENISIKCNAVFKNEIFFNKSKIESDLNKNKIFLSLK